MSAKQFDRTFAFLILLQRRAIWWVFAWSHFKADSAIHNAAQTFPQTMHLYWERSPIPKCHLDWAVFQAENHKNAYPRMIWGAGSPDFNIQKIIQGMSLLYFLLLSQNIQVINCYCNLQVDFQKTLILKHLHEERSDCIIIVSHWGGAPFNSKLD